MKIWRNDRVVSMLILFLFFYVLRFYCVGIIEGDSDTVSWLSAILALIIYSLIDLFGGYK